MTHSSKGNRSPDLAFRLARLGEQLRLLNSIQIAEVERFVTQLESNDIVERIKSEIDAKFPRCNDWPHAPTHRLSGKGTFMVTGGTLHKEHFFRSAERLTYLESELLSKAKKYDWQIEAWAVFSNHYHFVGHALSDAESLQPFLTHLHADTAREINQQENITDRQVWYNFRETELTYKNSYLARLNYVHQNAVKHGLVRVANQYQWCSAGWFERTATPAQVKTIYGFKTDKLKVVDDFDVVGV